MKNIKDYDLDALKQEFIELGEKPFRAEQVFKWLYEEKVKEFDEMTNLPKELRAQLSEFAYIADVCVYKKLVSVIDGTVKFVFRLYDNNFIETVVMKYKHGYSVCVSSQVGCRMGCAFCQSTKSGLCAIFCRERSSDKF